MTEFGIQGLELDFCIIGWGTDYVLTEEGWSNHMMKRYARGTPIRDPLALRRNAYRVLLTRARDGFVIYIPPDDGLEPRYAGMLDETREWLEATGVERLDEA